jgi:PERQ amino acid-rich with GYF domain-containing protein
MFHARQRELAQHHHQAFGRPAPIQPGVPGALHHHSSAHSLQSQPSFGSITSPIGMAAQHPIAPIGPAAGFFDVAASIPHGPTQAPIGAPTDLFAPDLNFSERQMLASMQATGSLPAIFPGSQAVGGPAGDGGLRSQLPGVDQLQKDPQGFSERLKEFQELRAQFDAEEAALNADQKVPGHSDVQQSAEGSQTGGLSGPTTTGIATAKAQAPAPESGFAKKTAAQAQAQSELSLSDKVRKTQADNAKSSQSSASDLPMPFPPPQATPLAAPTAQRPASNLPARYGERSASGTPDTTSDAAALAPPPTAPWAGTETQKGPSLKEIQEMEAKKAAKKEEAAAAARRAALEQEAAAIREREKAAAAAITGLPPTSTWGTGSPVGAPAGSPWKQPIAVKTGVAAGPAGSKKTLADIQREEELRKQKDREAAQASTPSASAMGKRYADLAGKGSAPPGLPTVSAVSQAGQGGGWSTVGAGGKVKIPTGPAVQNRSASASNMKPTPAPAVAKPAPKVATTSLKDAKNQAMEEFKKWLHRELSRGLIGVNDSELLPLKHAGCTRTDKVMFPVDQFAATLLEMPLDPSILSEAVYSYSTTMDCRHFADEFVRRKKLADKGVIEKEPISASANDPKNSSNGGWNEVAKKGSNNAAKEDTSVPGFRVVPSKKNKGKK